MLLKDTRICGLLPKEGGHNCYECGSDGYDHCLADVLDTEIPINEVVEIDGVELGNFINRFISDHAKVKDGYLCLTHREGMDCGIAIAKANIVRWK